MPDTSNPDDLAGDATHAADEDEAKAEHKADRPPTPEEEAAAPTEVDESVAEHYEESMRTGADVKGEGEI